MKYRCVLFDLDGTLVDTIADIALSMNRALEESGFSPRDPGEYPALVGRGIRKLALDSLPEKERNEENAALVAAAAARFYQERPVVHSKPYPGIPVLLSELARRKIHTAVLSNKPDPVTGMVIARLFPAGSFDIVRGEIPGVPRKPDPGAAWDILAQLGRAPHEAILAGDSEVDMETARNTGCFPLGVSWGFRSRQVLEDAGAALIINEPLELLRLL
ncbi:MAG: HAD family hydrolase [Treponema sp.]|jgi:phosphoglycolate phosphatase|nr:HAD family hydrolase [Treponema sp.]